MTAVRLARLALLPLVLLGTSFVASADVLRVPADYASIQDAVDAAAPGDVVLIAAGSYTQSVLVANQSITLVGDGGPAVIRRNVRVTDLAADQQVVLRGLTMNSSQTVGFDDGLLFIDCAGSVRVEDCFARGRDGAIGSWPDNIPSIEGHPGVRMQDCADVTLVRCTVRGGDGAGLDEEDTDPPPTQGGAGVFMRDSTVSLYDCDVRGGNGGSVTDTVTYQGGAGGSGLLLKSGSAHVQGGALTGGGGGSGDCDIFGCGSGGAGGHGLRQEGTASLSSVRDADLTGGTGGFSGDGQTMGSTGSPLSQTAGISLAFPAPYRDLVGNSPVREGETLELVFTGEPGDNVFLWISGLPGQQIFLPLRQGSFLVGFPVVLGGALLGTVPAGGVINVPLTVPEIGVEGGNLHWQAAFATEDDVLVGPVTVTTLLDASL